MALRSYPIWHDVQACHYKSNPSFGGKNNSSITVRVGSSRKNSHNFITHSTTRRFYSHEKHGRVCGFQFKIEGVVLREMVFTDNNGRAGEFLFEKTFEECLMENEKHRRQERKKERQRKTEAKLLQG